MAWVKIPKENHPLFRDCLPRDARVSTVNMFGGVAAKVNGQMFAGLFALGAVVKLSESDQRAALAIDGASMFDPMGNGRVMRDTVFLPESVLEEPEELRAWMRKALDHTAALPAKKTAKKPAAKAKPAAKPARKAPAGRAHKQKR
jgi:TfoX/Sxy family transcriptional regulator of competence genes